MRTSSFELAQCIARESCRAPDVLLASDYIDVPALFRALPRAEATELGDLRHAVRETADASYARGLAGAAVCLSCRRW